MYQPPQDSREEEYGSDEAGYVVNDEPETSYDGGPAYQAPPPDGTEYPTRRKFSIFKPRLTKPNFILSVLVNAVRILLIVIVLGGLAMPFLTDNFPSSMLVLEMAIGSPSPRL